MRTEMLGRTPIVWVQSLAAQRFGAVGSTEAGDHFPRLKCVFQPLPGALGFAIPDFFYKWPCLSIAPTWVFVEARFCKYAFESAASVFWVFQKKRRTIADGRPFTLRQPPLVEYGLVVAPNEPRCDHWQGPILGLPRIERFSFGNCIDHKRPPAREPGAYIPTSDFISPRRSCRPTI
jgi:hypothetical protein